MAPTTLGAPCSGTSAHTLPAAGYTCEYGEALTSTSPGLKCRQADEHPQDATLNFCLWNVHKEADWTTGKKKPLSSPLNLLLSNVWLCVWWEMEEETSLRTGFCVSSELVLATPGLAFLDLNHVFVLFLRYWD